ncbi:MAG: MFS transporter [Acidimicrobiales bacterium]
MRLLTAPFRRFGQDVAGLWSLRRTPYGLTPVLVLGFISITTTFDFVLFEIGGPQFLRRGNISVTSIIGLIAYVGLVTAFTNLAMGWYADRHRRVPFAGIGTILSAPAAGLTGIGRSTLTVGGARAGAAVASNGIAQIPVFSLLADYYPVDARGRMFAAINLFVSLGGIVAPAVSGLLFEHFGLPHTFMGDGVLIGLSGVLVLVFLREPVRGYFDRKWAGVDEEVAKVEEAPQSFGEGFRSVFAVRTLRRIFVAQVVLGAVAILGLFQVIVLYDHYNLSVLGVGLFFVPSGVAALFGAVYGGSLVDRYSRRDPGRVMYVFGVFVAVNGLGLIGYAVEPPLAVLVVSSCVVTFGLSLVGPALLAVITSVTPPAVRTQGIQTLGLAAVPGTVFGFSLLSIIFDRYGSGPVFYVGLGATLVGAAIFASAAPLYDFDRRSATAGAVAAEAWRRSRQEGDERLLICRDLSVGYEGVQVLFGVDLDVSQGQILALLGTNGAGKSTLLRAISGTQEASGGSIVFEGRDITHMPPHEITARGLVQMPGGRGLFPGMTVRDNLLLATWLTEDPADSRQAMEEALEIFPILRDRGDEQAGTLSGGEQQMLSLAQAFMLRPRLLLIDELSLGLSPAVVGRLVEAVKEINRRGVTVIVVEQSVNVALELADEAVFLEKGEVRFVGPTADLMQRPDILRAVYVRGTGATASSGSSRESIERERRLASLEDTRVVLEADGLVKRFGGVTALDGASLQLREEEILGIIGPNGSGKTTLFDTLSGYLVPDAGVVRMDGLDVTRLGPDARSRLGMLRRFQDARLYPSLTVLEALLIALEPRLEIRNVVLVGLGWPGARRSETRARARAERLIEMLHLGVHRDKLVRELSTGLRRIVDLACVLAAEPKVVLLDEPSSGIAQAEAEALGPLLRQVRHEVGCSMLLIEHDMPLITAVADELLAMDQGQVIARGLPETVLSDPRVEASYLGDSEATIQRSGSLR